MKLVITFTRNEALGRETWYGQGFVLVFWVRELTTLGMKAGLTEKGSSMEARGCVAYCKQVRQPVPAGGCSCRGAWEGKGGPAALFLERLSPECCLSSHSEKIKQSSLPLGSASTLLFSMLSVPRLFACLLSESSCDASRRDSLGAQPANT